VPPIDLSDQIEPLIDAALQAERANEPERDYLGGSEIGDLCERRVAFKWHKAKRKPVGGRGLRRFRMGHIHEHETARWLKLAGFKLKGEQLRFHLVDGKFSGGVDGVLLDGPLALPYPLLWENKIMKAVYWRECKRGGVELTNPEYFAQTQIYMRQFDLSHCLFTALNTDTSELYPELVPFVPAKAETFIDRAQRIILSQSPEEFPRLCHNAQDFNGKFCDFHEVCWAAPQRPATPTPSWLKKRT
jgi:hypothetical protein